jgi:hypothetical protein
MVLTNRYTGSLGKRWDGVKPGTKWDIEMHFV